MIVASMLGPSEPPECASCTSEMTYSDYAHGALQFATMKLRFAAFFGPTQTVIFVPADRPRQIAAGRALRRFFALFDPGFRVPLAGLVTQPAGGTNVGRGRQAQSPRRRVLQC